MGLIKLSIAYAEWQGMHLEIRNKSSPLKYSKGRRMWWCVFGVSCTVTVGELFTCVLLNDAVFSSNHTASNDDLTWHVGLSTYHYVVRQVGIYRIVTPNSGNVCVNWQYGKGCVDVWPICRPVLLMYMFIHIYEQLSDVCSIRYVKRTGISYRRQTFIFIESF